MTWDAPSALLPATMVTSRHRRPIVSHESRPHDHCLSLVGQGDRFFAHWAGLAQLAIERGRMALQDHLRDFPDRAPSSTSRRANAICSGVSFGGRPKRTPRVLAAARP